MQMLKFLLLFAVIAAQQTPNVPPTPLVKENATVKVSDHVYVIPDGNVGGVPNIGIIVGTRATLVVDSGLGRRNGETVVREVGKVSKNAELYVVATHFHAEHSLGEVAFPASAKVIRARTQQQDIDELGITPNFGARSPAMAELVKDAQFRKADELFDREKILDLGGVRVRIFRLAQMHTRGDTMVFVEGDGVLLAGDVVMNRRFVGSGSAKLGDWIGTLEFLQSLRPSTLVPSHGEVGPGALVQQTLTYMTTVRSRVTELKSQGKTADDAVQTVSSEIRSKFPDWTSPNAVTTMARAAYAEAP